MAWLRTVWIELLGLFIDDGRFALTIVVWLALCWLALPRIGLPPPVPPVILFAGLAAILVESAMRRAKAATFRRE